MVALNNCLFSLFQKSYSSLFPFFSNFHKVSLNSSLLNLTCESLEFVLGYKKIIFIYIKEQKTLIYRCLNLSINVKSKSWITFHERILQNFLFIPLKVEAKFVANYIKNIYSNFPKIFLRLSSHNRY